MGLIINIDEALKLRTDYNILREPLNAMLTAQQEAWEKQNPIDFIFNRGSISKFQETYTSSIGFEHAFAETSDYNIGPIFNTAEGFAATYRTRTFQGGFIITQQTLEDRELGKAKDDASQFIRRWHGDVVEYAMTAITGGFGKAVTWGSSANGGSSRIQLFSADTVDGDITNPNKNPLFSASHKTVKRDADHTPVTQSNMFRAVDANGNKAINIGGSDPGQIAKLADFIYQVITEMENYKDDNGKIAGVMGAKTIVCSNDAHLVAALRAALSTPAFCETPNPGYQIATVNSTPYLNGLSVDSHNVFGKRGFLILDKAYNAANHGPEITERVAFTLDVTQQKRPSGIVYDGRQRMDINCASWRGITYCLLDTASSTSTDWDYSGNFTSIVPVETIVKPVSIVGDAGVEITNTTSNPVQTHANT